MGKALPKESPVEEDSSSDHLVWVGACPRSPHLLSFQGIKHRLNRRQYDINPKTFTVITHKCSFFT